MARGSRLDDLDDRMIPRARIQDVRMREVGKIALFNFQFSISFSPPFLGMGQLPDLACIDYIARYLPFQVSWERRMRQEQAQEKPSSIHHPTCLPSRVMVFHFYRELWRYLLAATMISPPRRLAPEAHFISSSTYRPMETQCVVNGKLNSTYLAR